MLLIAYLYSEAIIALMDEVFHWLKINPFFYIDEIKAVLDEIESNIVYENRFFLPVLEDNMDEIALFELYIQERMMGFALIRL